MSDDDILDFITDGLNLRTTPETNEERLYMHWTEGKMPRIYNCHYWVKHQVFVYMHDMQNGWYMSKPSKDGRKQLTIKELVRHWCKYYFEMTTHDSFYGIRAKERGKDVDIQKFLDLVMEHPDLKKLVDDPSKRI